MEAIESIDKLRRVLGSLRMGSAVGLVPTMGALHAGHGRLIDQARADCGCVVVSVFVNPIQFNDLRDLQLYPRDLSSDLEFCRAHGMDIVFAPTAAEMYRQPLNSFVDVAE